MTFDVSQYNRPVTQAIANLLNQGMTLPTILGGTAGTGWWNKAPDPSTAVDPQTGKPFDLSTNPNASWNGNGWVDNQTGNIVAISGDPNTQAQGRGQLFGDMNATGPTGYGHPLAPPSNTDPTQINTWLKGLDQSGVEGMNSESGFHFDPTYGLVNDPGNVKKDTTGFGQTLSTVAGPVIQAIAMAMIGGGIGGAATGLIGQAGAGAAEGAAGADTAAGAANTGSFLSPGVSNALGKAAGNALLTEATGGKVNPLTSLLGVAGAAVGPTLGAASGLTDSAGTSLANTGLGAIANGGISPSGILSAGNILAGSPLPSWATSLGGGALNYLNQPSQPSQSPIPPPQPAQTPTFAQLLANSNQNAASPTAPIGKDMTKAMKKGGMVKKGKPVRAMADGDIVDPSSDYTGPSSGDPGWQPAPVANPTDAMNAVNPYENTGGVPATPSTQDEINALLNGTGTPGVGNLNVSGGSGSSNPLSALGNALFGPNGGSLANWASILGPLIGAGMNSSATGKATQQMTDAINNANNTATSMFGTAQQNLLPWQQVGLKAVNTLSNQAPSTIGSQFAPIQGGGALAPQFKPLGSGKGLNMETGGNISGPGGPREDKVPIMASNGEFIINSASTDKFRPLLEWINKQGKHMADGGAVSDPSMLDKLKKMLSPNSVPGSLDQNNRAGYMKYVLDTQGSGETPKIYTEWLKLQTPPPIAPIAPAVPAMASGGGIDPSILLGSQNNTAVDPISSLKNIAMLADLFRQFSKGQSTQPSSSVPAMASGGGVFDPATYFANLGNSGGAYNAATSGDPNTQSSTPSLSSVPSTKGPVNLPSTGSDPVSGWNPSNATFGMTFSGLGHPPNSGWNAPSAPWQPTKTDGGIRNMPITGGGFMNPASSTSPGINSDYLAKLLSGSGSGGAPVTGIFSGPSNFNGSNPPSGLGNMPGMNSGFAQMLQQFLQSRGGQSTLPMQINGGRMAMANGGLVPAFANGGAFDPATYYANLGNSTGAYNAASGNTAASDPSSGDTQNSSSTTSPGIAAPPASSSTSTSSPSDFTWNDWSNNVMNGSLNQPLSGPTSSTSATNPMPAISGGASSISSSPIAPTTLNYQTPTPTSQTGTGSAFDPTTGQQIALPNASYGVNVGDYLNPGSNYAQDQALRAIQQSAAGRGGLISSGTNKDIVNQAMGLGLQNYNNAFNQANQVGQFNYGVDTGDQNFAYNAANNDRNYQTALDQYNQNFGFNAANTQWNQNNQLQNQLAGYGLNATGQSNSLQAALAQLLGQNIMTGGQVAAGGTMGQNNALTGGITGGVGALTNTNLYNQLMQMMNQNKPVAATATS